MPKQHVCESGTHHKNLQKIGSGDDTLHLKSYNMSFLWSRHFQKKKKANKKQ
jgi:hypothetical protein